MSGTVVVGVDGSRGSVRALRWALAEAADHGYQVEVVTAWPHTGPVFVREVPGHHSDARERARTAQHQAIREARTAATDAVAVSAVLENARPEEALSLRARGRRMLVVGAGADHVEQARTELAERCRERVDCPVAIVVADAGETEVLEPLLARTHG
ncbi:hypothetical protein GCM10009844_40360 [Nocardioides koreensis]|uniref:UspA domain-containing protein n=1 Tax=Nocardioides koreensis TaxID=433651 RepID=A0ABP5LZ76_9ACTN